MNHVIMGHVHLHMTRNGLYLYGDLSIRHSLVQSIQLFRTCQTSVYVTTISMLRCGLLCTPQDGLAVPITFRTLAANDFDRGTLEFIENPDPTPHLRMTRNGLHLYGDLLSI
jgi:hypothetical protein